MNGIHRKCVYAWWPCVLCYVGMMNQCLFSMLIVVVMDFMKKWMGIHGKYICMYDVAVWRWLCGYDELSLIDILVVVIVGFMIKMKVG